MNALELRRRTLGKGVYKKTAEGNPAIAQGSLSRRNPGITMQGWTEQDSTTGAQLLNLTKNTVTDSGIICVSEGSTITISGERVVGDGVRLTYVTSAFTLQPGTYRFSYEKFNDVNSSILSTILMKQADNKILDNAFTLAEETNLYIGVNILQGKTADNAVIRCMLNEGSTALPWEPYTGGAPSPNPDYPQEIVSAGKYNEDMQKWEYEITIANEQTDPDKNQTVTLTADRPLTKWDRLEKRNGQWGWVYKSMEITLDGSENWGVYAAYEGFSVRSIFDTPRLRSEGFSERFICETGSTNLGKYTLLWLGANNYNIYFVKVPQYNAELSDSGLQDWKDYLAENPLTILTYADDETFVPLSESEQEQMNALYTFRPTTVLSNDCECDMTLTYKTKKSLQPVSGGYKEA